MRRGHPNVSGWRGDNHRHFRPRNHGAPHFRPSRPYGPHDAPRFLLNTPRQYRPIRPYNPGPAHVEAQLEPHDRNHYRGNNSRINQDRDLFTRDRHKPPPYQNQRDNDNYNEVFYNDDDGYVNSMGDTDHRRPHMQNQEFPINPWVNPPPTFEYNKQYYDERNAHKTPRRYNNEETLPEYSGHRPPSSDHYTAPSNNNNSQFAHSVDDTVDIVRKKLMNRDKTPCPESPIHQSNMDEDLRQDPARNYQPPPEQPVKKKRQKQNIKQNCNNMKNKIVHQLFKMDKSKIHKLMDNPSSSSKFEYAISTLITEGQNSLNRHMRSVAEKSLYSSSSDFIQDDRNTIYEDTFMKQMQGVLDPQDTVLLEDIKPMVMAELSRVLQLNDLAECIQHQSSMDLEPGEYVDDEYNAFNYTENYNDQETFYNNTDSTDSYNRSAEEPIDSKPLFERRPLKQTESHEECKSIESNKSVDTFTPQSPEPPIVLFDPNTDHLSDDDYPFAELDKQYHVAVDHNFIENASCVPSPQHSLVDVSNDSFMIPNENEISKKSPIEIKKEIKIQVPTSSNEIDKEIDSQLLSIAKSPVKLFSFKDSIKTETQNTRMQSENEISIKKVLNIKSESKINEKEMHGPENVTHKESFKKEVEDKKSDSMSTSKSVLQPNSRKRSTDQKPSHRKEKRKKRSESESQAVAKSIANMFYSNDDHKNGQKDHKKSADKTYSDKYVKRKDKKDKVVQKVEESKKPNNNSSHSILSPKNSLSQETPNKSDAKTKFKHIDIFVEQPKKPGPIHLAPRNTADVKTPEDSKPKTPLVPSFPITPFNRKLSKRHVGTQVIIKNKQQGCQTPKMKTKTKCKEIQTDPISITSKSVASNPLERMKEIDMEIQVLLQEKFQLYNSIESKSKADSIDTIPSLSMRIFDMDQSQDKTNDSEDAIVDEFTSIPTEELEKIAMETFEDKSPPKDKQGRRHNVVKLSRKNSESPTAKRNKKVKTPNISLIEQIITDTRPIEEIITLDDFETYPTNLTKSKKKRPKLKPKKKKSKKSKKGMCVSDDIKPCCVVLERIDVDQCLRPFKSLNETLVEKKEDIQVEVVNTCEKTEVLSEENVTSEVVEVNDLQFDMLDVSEDIVIGDNCEVKTVDKVDRALSEGIILDNSQSSMEDQAQDNVEVDNECKLYDYSANENLRRDAITVTGNADAVLAIQCIENDFIAACLDGNVYHFNSEGQIINSFKGSNLAVTCLTIVKEKYGTTLYTGSLDSRIRYYDLETGLEKGPECNVLSPIQSMDRAWDTIFVGTRTGFVLQFECKNNMLIPVSTVKFSEHTVLALRALKEGPRKVLLVAARSEDVTVRDAQTGLLLRTLAGPKTLTVYTLLFEDGKVYCGTSSHSIHVFDYTSGSHVGTHEGGKGAVCLLASGGLVFAGCYDGCVYVYREGEAQPFAQLRGPSLMLLSLAIRDAKIIVGYKDRGLYIWKMPLPILKEMIL